MSWVKTARDNVRRGNPYNRYCREGGDKVRYSDDGYSIYALGNMFEIYPKKNYYKMGTECYEQLVARAGRDHPKIALVLDDLLNDVKDSLSGEWSYGTVNRPHPTLPNTRILSSPEIIEMQCEYAISICKRQFGPNDPRTVKFCALLDNCRRGLMQQAREKQERESIRLSYLNCNHPSDYVHDDCIDSEGDDDGGGDE